MTQEAVQITTTPPLPGLQLVQDMNKAMETIATDFAGSTDPAATAWAYSTWADTGTGTFKRRNAANSAWAIEGRLLRAHLPMYAQVDVPALDIGPIYIIGKGPAEWDGAAYKPMISGIPGATFAELDAATSDQGPAICTDMGGYLYKWVETAYFSGYRNVRIGELPDSFATINNAWWMAATGGVWNEADPKQRRLIAWFREQGQVMAAIDWAPRWGRIADLGGGDWKAADLQNVFKRYAGTDADTANPAGAGSYKGDTLKATEFPAKSKAGLSSNAYGSNLTVMSNVLAGNPADTPVTAAIGGAETAPKHTRVAALVLI